MKSKVSESLKNYIFLKALKKGNSATTKPFINLFLEFLEIKKILL